MQHFHWVKDYLPDMLWMAATITHNNEVHGMRIVRDACSIFSEVANSTNQNESEGTGTLFDGSLSSIERVPIELRTRIARSLEDQGVYQLAFTEDFANALLLYPDAPGRWIIEPYIERGLEPDAHRAMEYLIPIMMECIHGQTRVATHIKFMVLMQYLLAGKVSFSNTRGLEWVNLLHKYPGGLTEDELRRVRPSIRATYAAFLDRTEDSEAKRWAKSFWRSNWELFPCAVSEDHVIDDDVEDSSTPDESATMRDNVKLLVEDFLTLARGVDPDLYAPDRYEVLTGITYRALQTGLEMCRTPLLLSGDFGMQLFRGIVEAYITMHWLVSRDEESLFIKFKDYGRGKLKQYKLHLEDYVDKMNDVPSDLLEHLKYLDESVNSDIWEEFQDIPLTSSFSGSSLYKMAKDVDMTDAYNLWFSPASGATHGEWTSLDRYVLTQCVNPLHRQHRIPASADRGRITTVPVGLIFQLCEHLWEIYAEAVSPNLIEGASDADGPAPGSGEGHQ